ncbi:hypothetical protein IWX46DRAFT_86644 [Phyllosticta citricarpa]|uniref:Uncharacterized protein n=1 Tax=Phyllosticta citricarpa TaxID=55181 RepID=A0ABR1MDA2_9PEZI
MTGKRVSLVTGLGWAVLCCVVVQPEQAHGPPGGEVQRSNVYIYRQTIYNHQETADPLRRARRISAGELRKPWWASKRLPADASRLWQWARAISDAP